MSSPRQARDAEEETNVPEEGKPTTRMDPDAEFFRNYGIGCLVIILVFIAGVSLIAYMWLHGG